MYPFLDCAKQAFKSIGNFVKHTLPQIQSRSPQVLAATAEAELGQEMKSNATIVSGDGSEMPTGEQQLHDFSIAESRLGTPSTSDTDDLDREPPPSWMRSPNLSKNPPKFAVGDHGKKSTGNVTVEMVEDIHQIPNISLSPASPELAANQHHRRPLFPRRHRSQSLFHPTHRSPTQHAPTPQQQTRRATAIAPSTKSRSRVSTLRTATLTMTSTSSPSPPPPALRISSKGGSHPDLTRLVGGWSCSSGPASQSMLYQAVSR